MNLRLTSQRKRLPITRSQPPPPSTRRHRAMLISLFIHLSFSTVHGGVMDGRIVQSPSLTVGAGGSVLLQCNFVTPGKVPEVVAFQWDLPGGGAVLRVVPGSGGEGGLPGRMTLHADLSLRSSALEIHNVTLGDDGLYRCLVEILEPLPIVRLWGTGTELSVQQHSLSHPPSPQLSQTAGDEGHSGLVAAQTESWQTYTLYTVVGVLLLIGLAFSVSIRQCGFNCNLRKDSQEDSAP
ncbi:uncharacterized protein LOC121851470 [Callorhinchus milii]|uniref:uncharacterized protein LOC121851470 n=1 Tax=Callorhinchus milii TaxID=7868 RepID=UPI001C3F97C6|nr:uncharacterized protein LOC121851470 [Callorhinchus milii]